MQIYEKTIGELRMEIGRLQEKIDVYENTIMDLRDHIAQLEAKIDVLKTRLGEVAPRAVAPIPPDE
jgi:phage shock protein A